MVVKGESEMYFVLKCPPLVNKNGEALMEIHNCFEVGNVWDWCDGLSLESDEKNFPIPINIDFEPFRGYVGPPRELVDVCIPIMSKRLADTLLEAGVDNVEFFPATLKNTITGQTYEYRAFKIVGLVAAADLSKSEWTSYDGKSVADVGFENLVLDKSKTRGLLIFRLAENINALMVHERVRKHIIANGIDTLTFVKPEDWVHL
jgi:hypothetical protein